MNATATALEALQRDLFADPVDAAPTDERSATGTAGRVYVLYRCRPCERATQRPKVWRGTFSKTTTRTGPYALTTWTADGRSTKGDHPPARPCAACQRPTGGEQVKGRFSASRRCDARCIYARGSNCECSCAGANHGAGHSR